MASTFSAPGVYRREIDLSDIIVPAGISNGGTVVRAKKGPIRRPVLVTNDKEYIRPEDGLINIDFTIAAPNEVNSEFDGNITIVNKQNLNDIENVLITLKTSKNKMLDNNMFERLILRFPILEFLL